MGDYMDFYKIYLMLPSKVKQMDLKSIKRLALASQILKLSGLKVDYNGEEKIILKDYGHYIIEIHGGGGEAKYLISEPDQYIQWIPKVEIKGLKEFLSELGLLITSSNAYLLYNPLPINIFTIYSNAFYFMQPFSVYKYKTREAINVSNNIFRIRSSVNIVLHEKYIKICIGSRCFFIYGIKQAKSVKKIDTSLVLEDSNIRFVISLVKPYIYAEVNDCLDLCVNWLNAHAYFLTPYYIHHEIIDLVNGDTYCNGLIGLNNSFFLSIANPFLQNIEVNNSCISLCNSIFMIYYSLHLNYKDLFSFMISSIMCKENLIMEGVTPSLEITDLIHYYPQSIMLAEYLFDCGDVGMVLANPFNLAVNTTIYSLLPIKDPLIYTANIIEGYKPAILKPNMISFTIKPYSIVIVKFGLEPIDKGALLIRNVWRKLGKKSEY